MIACLQKFTWKVSCGPQPHLPLRRFSHFFSVLQKTHYGITGIYTNNIVHGYLKKLTETLASKSTKSGTKLSHCFLDQISRCRIQLPQTINCSRQTIRSGNQNSKKKKKKSTSTSANTIAVQVTPKRPG